MGKLQIKRGLSVNLPTEASVGEMLFTTDTKTVYIGNGEGNTLTEFNNASQLASYLAQKADSEHSHTLEDITDFATSVDERITAQKGQANGLALLDATGKIPNTCIPNVFKEATVVNDIDARDALTPFAGLHALVIDASDDNTVAAGGGAEYVYNGTKWVKISEFNNLDTVIDWENVQNKPTLITNIKDLEGIPTLEGQSGKILSVAADGKGFELIAAQNENFDGGTF